MGREIRRVPPDWEHPREACRHSPWAGGCEDAKAHGGRCYKPLLEGDFLIAAREWLDQCLAWEDGTHKDAAKYKEEYPFYWQWDGGPPDEESYRPMWPAETATHFQIYETVSEGTPISPVLPSSDAIIDWLVAQGYSRTASDAFAKSGWAMSGMGIPGVGFVDGITALGMLPVK